MKPPKRLSDIRSVNARRALIRVARAQGVVPKEIGPENGLIKPETMAWLEEHGLAHLTVNRKKRAIWRPTDLGRGLVAQHVPRLLHRRSDYGYTSSPAMAMNAEPEAMDAPKRAA